MIGIYKITNKINGHCYIGQSIDIQRRWACHKNSAIREKSSSHNYPLQKAMRKYGIDNFELEIYQADWKHLGRKAGLLRNIEMVEGSRFGHKPDILISFNMGTRGTQHTIDYWRSKYPNKPVYEIKC